MIDALDSPIRTTAAIPIARPLSSLVTWPILIQKMARKSPRPDVAASLQARPAHGPNRQQTSLQTKFFSEFTGLGKAPVFARCSGIPSSDAVLCMFCCFCRFLPGDFSAMTIAQ